MTMQNRTKTLLTLAAVASVFALASAAQAGTVTVPNGDFEDRTGTQYQDAANWTITGIGATGGYVANETNPTIFSDDADAGGDATPTYLFLSGVPTATSADLIAAVSGLTYTATVQIGEPKTGYSLRPNTYSIELLVGGVSKNTATSAPPATDDSWAPLSVDYLAIGADAGQQVSIRLSEIGGGAQSFYDNVTLTTVPEPSGIAISLLCLVGLLVRRRRS